MALRTPRVEMGPAIIHLVRLGFRWLASLATSTLERVCSPRTARFARSTVARQAWWTAQLSGLPSPTTPPARQAVQLGLVGRPAQFAAQIGGLLTTIYDRHSEL